MRPRKKDPIVELFKQLKPLLERYSPPLIVKKDSDTSYELRSNKQVVIADKMTSEIFFAAFIVQKGYVGFYYSPIYTHPEIRRNLPPNLIKLLKGKSCFHITEESPELFVEIESALRFGFNFYKRKDLI